MNAMPDKAASIASPQQSAAPEIVAAPPRRSAFTRWLRPVVAVLAVLVLLVTAAWWLNEGRYIETTDNAYVRGDIAVLGPRIEGDVLAIPVTDNQAVKAGDPLIVLDDRDWKARLAQAAASTSEAQAAVRTAQSQVVQARTMIASSDAAITQAQAELTRASSDAVRSDALVKSGWASRQADETVVAQATKARAAMAAAQAQKATTEQALVVARAQVEQATARAEMAVAAQALAQNSLGYTVIRAPFDGIVGNRAAQLGQHVATGAQLIAVTPPPASLYVIANFKETQLARMQAHEFGLTRPGGARLAGLLALLNDVRSAGLDAAQGMLLTEPFYWDLNDRTRRLTAAVQSRMPNGLYPSTNHAGAYSATLHCLRAVQAMGGPDKARSGRMLVAQMKAMPTDDDGLGKGRIREDGRKIHNAYLFEVKAPGQNKGEWDLYNLVDTIPAEQAFRPVAEGGCPLVKP